MDNKNNNIFIKAITIACLCIGLFSVIYITINSLTFVTATSRVENISLSETPRDLQFPTPFPLYVSQSWDHFEELREGEITLDELGEDLNSFNFALNGVIFTFPTPFAEFENRGWRIYLGPDSYTDILEPGHTIVAILTRGGMGVRYSESALVGLGNFSDQPIYVRDSYITYVQFDSYRMELGIRLYFPGKITIGSTYEEVIALYGEPDDIFVYGEIQMKELYFVSDHCFRAVIIKVDLETNEVYSLEWFYLAALDNFSF